MMSINLLKEVNNLLIEATFEASDEEILGLIGKDGYPNAEEVSHIQTTIQNKVHGNRESRLQNAKRNFSRDINQTNKIITTKKATRTIEQMLGDIVSAMQNTDKVPDGLLIAFREQSKSGEANESDIRDIWESLVRLGLIDDENS